MFTYLAEIGKRTGGAVGRFGQVGPFGQVGRCYAAGRDGGQTAFGRPRRTGLARQAAVR
jgi:hypothetical protein